MNRAYGGVLSGSAVRERFVTFVRVENLSDFDGCWPVPNMHVSLFLFPCRIIRAFLVEEQKIVKKVLKIQKAKEKLASKS